MISKTWHNPSRLCMDHAFFYLDYFHRTKCSHCDLVGRWMGCGMGEEDCLSKTRNKVVKAKTHKNCVFIYEGRFSCYKTCRAKIFENMLDLVVLDSRLFVYLLRSGPQYSSTVKIVFKWTIIFLN